MTISSIVNASGMLAGLGPSGNSFAGQPASVHELILAVIAIAVWLIAIACATAWLRAREKARAREHIRWIRIDRRRARSFSAPPRPYRPATSRKPGHSWVKPMEQM
jgi:hypothetical protein